MASSEHMVLSFLFPNKVFGKFGPPYQVEFMKQIATKLLFLEGAKPGKPTNEKLPPWEVD